MGDWVSLKNFITRTTRLSLGIRKQLDLQTCHLKSVGKFTKVIQLNSTNTKGKHYKATQTEKGKRRSCFDLKQDNSWLRWTRFWRIQMFRDAIINNSQATSKSRSKMLTKSVKALTTKISFLFVKLRTTRKANNPATFFLRKTRNVWQVALQKLSIHNTCRSGSLRSNFLT